MSKLLRTPINADEQKVWNGTNWEATPNNPEKSKPRSKTLSPPPNRSNKVSNDGETSQNTEKSKTLTEDEVTQIIKQRALSKTVFREEQDFIDFMNNFIESLIQKTDMATWKAQQQAFKALIDKYGVDTTMKYFIHLDTAFKFAPIKENWQEELQKTKYFIVKNQKFNILEISDPASFCFKRMRNLTASVQVDVDKIEAIDEDVADESGHETSSGQDSSKSDDDDHETFEQIVQKEPKRGYKKYLKTSRGLGGLRKKFNMIIQSLDSLILKNKKSPEINRDNLVRQNLIKLQQQYAKIEERREEALSNLSEKARAKDNYLEPIYQSYLDTKAQVKKNFPGIKIDEVFVAPQLKEDDGPDDHLCDFCASKPMSKNLLLKHMADVHSIFDYELEENTSPKISKKPQKIQNPDFSIGSYKPKGHDVTSSTDCNSSEDESDHFKPKTRAKTVQSHEKQPINSFENQMNQFLEIQKSMAQIQASNFFKIDEICGIFDPNKFISSPLDQLKAYKNWKLEVDDLTEMMERLGYSEERKYQTLKTRVKNTAKDIIIEDKPDNGSFKRALQKLDNYFWSKNLHVRNIVHQFKKLPKMDNNSATKVSNFTTEAISLMEQLQELFGVNSENEIAVYLLFSEILVSKFNAEAKKHYNSLLKEDGKTKLGHNLTIQDLKNVLTTTQKSMKHREFDRAFLSETNPPKSQNKNKRSKSEEKPKFMQENFSFSTDNKNSGLKKRRDPVAGELCRVPNCGTVLQKGSRNQGFHLYQAACPKLRKMNYDAVAKWVSDQGITCFHCFSVEHSSQNCQFKDTKCRRIIKIGNKEQKCGKNHHVALHSEIKHGKIVKSVNQQPPAVSNKY